MPRRTDRLSVTELIRPGLEVLYMNVGGKVQFVVAKNVNLRDFGASLTVFSQRKGMEL
jgi:hypothetical protein